MKKVFVLVFVLLTSVPGFAANETVSWYPFEESLWDMNQPYEDGIIKPEGVAAYIPGGYDFGPLLEQALYLDGSQYVDIGYGQPKGEVMRNGAVSLWFNMAAEPIQYKMLFGTMNNGVTKAIWAGIPPSNLTEFGMRDAQGQNIAWTYDNRRAVSPDTWYFYTVTWGINQETGNMDINEYLNGELTRSGTRPDIGAVSWQYSMYLGAGNSRGNAEDLWVGALDEIKFYDYPLSHSAIIQTYVDITGNPVCLERPATDVNGDCKVDLNDLAIIVCVWLADGNLYPSE